jgi:hypothetical protein
MNIQEFFSTKTPEQTARTLFTLFGGNDNARATAIIVRSQHPMYTGNLNPKWAYWNDVLEWICKCPEDLQNQWFFERINTPSVYEQTTEDIEAEIASLCEEYRKWSKMHIRASAIHSGDYRNKMDEVQSKIGKLEAKLKLLTATV